MALATQHTFQVLTKRPERMNTYLRDDDLNMRLSAALGEMLDGNWIWQKGKRFRPRIEKLISAFVGHDTNRQGNIEYLYDPMSLPNVWLGTSIEDQETADERLPFLLKVPAQIRIVSAEPLLGRIEMEWALTRNRLAMAVGFQRRGHFAPGFETLRPLDCAIVGGESGNGFRHMEDEWARDLLMQCRSAGVSFFMKQMGGFSKSRMRTIPPDLLVQEFPS